MRLVKIAVASVNTTVGAVDSNVRRLVEMAHSMEDHDVTLACFPEQVVGGYPPEDLIQWSEFVRAQRRGLDRFAAETAGLPTVFAVGLAVDVGAQLFNCAAVVHGGRILGFVPKEKLPTYHVFYEERTFSRGAAGMALESGGVPLGDYLFEFDFGVLAVDVCEDAWSPDGPFRRRCYSGAEIVFNVSASPYRIGIVSTRREMFSTRSADNQATFVHANAVGGQDGLIFDGGGYILQNGRMVLDAPRLEEGWSAGIVDLDRTRRMRQENTTWRVESNVLRRRDPVPILQCRAATADRSRLPYPAPRGGSFFLPADTKAPAGISERDEVLDDLIEVLALGVKDYYQKTGAFRALGVALSGGRDSVLTLLIAWRAAQLLYPELEAEDLESRAAATITTFYMPSRYSQADTNLAAETLCRELGVELREVSIDEAFDRELEAAAKMLGDDAEPTAIARENIQARLRASRMWNWANTAGALFLQTGDMSEKAVGYTTIGGDLEGGLSVIANVPKTVVIALLERLEKRFDLEGVRLCLATEPGPELAADQTAESELMPFPVLDACLRLYAGDKLAPAEVGRILPDLFPEHAPDQLAAWAEQFAVLFTRSIYKWVQAPLSLHVGSLDLDRERALQLPVVQRNEWGDGESN